MFIFRTKISLFIIKVIHSIFPLFFISLKVNHHYLVHIHIKRLAVFANGYNFIGVKPLPEEDAIKSGAEMISETIVLCIAGNNNEIEHIHMYSDLLFL